MPKGYKTLANSDIDLLLLAKHHTGLSEGPSHPGDNSPTRHCSLSLSPPSRHATTSQSGKGHRFLSPRDLCSAAASAPPPAAGTAAAPLTHAPGTLK